MRYIENGGLYAEAFKPYLNQVGSVSLADDGAFNKEQIAHKNWNLESGVLCNGVLVWPSEGKFLREPPGGPRSGCEARSEANPVRWRPCEAGARPNGKYQASKKSQRLKEIRHWLF